MGTVACHKLEWLVWTARAKRLSTASGVLSIALLHMRYRAGSTQTYDLRMHLVEMEENEDGPGMVVIRVAWKTAQCGATAGN